jgi:Restriction endonuclease EcoRV
MAKRSQVASDGRDTLVTWLRGAAARYKLEPIAVYRAGRTSTFPITAKSEDELRAKLKAGGHFLPLPKEPASLANVLEVSLIEFLLQEISKTKGAVAQRGTERGYPDIEITGKVFGDVPHAIDIKAARRKIGKSGKVGTQTQSRITLYTGNTYFRYPQLHWPATLRPFQDYGSHLSLIAIYTLNETSDGRIEDLELIAHETWRIGSKQRSSTTREYLGAVQKLEDLRAGKGEFDTEEAFYAYWRKYSFNIGRAVQQQLDKLLKARS